MNESANMSLLPPRLRRFVSVNAWHMRCFGCDFDTAVSDGEIAMLKCIEDGEADLDGNISHGAKLFVRREMLRASSPAWLPKYNTLRDYGYVDGRTTKKGAVAPPKNKQMRHRQKMAEMGLCTICGRDPVPDQTLCLRCKTARRIQRMRRIERAGHRVKRWTKTRMDEAILAELNVFGNEK